MCQKIIGYWLLDIGYWLLNFVVIFIFEAVLIFKLVWLGEAILNMLKVDQLSFYTISI